MAALLLSVAGAAAGGAVFGSIGAIAGRIVGALAGNVIDHALLSPNTARAVEGPRLSDLDVMASTEGLERIRSLPCFPMFSIIWPNAR